MPIDLTKAENAFLAFLATKRRDAFPGSGKLIHQNDS